MLDVLELVAFTIIGSDIAVSTGTHVSVVVRMGMITGIAGGLLRDMLCNQVLLALQRELYTTVSFATVSPYMGLLSIGMSRDWAAMAALCADVAFRLVAIRFSPALPVLAIGQPAPERPKKEGGN